MDRARSFDFCQQLPRRTVTDVNTSDRVYARQVLLNESWPDYCKRRNKPELAAETHEKWVTETWDDYMRRAVNRAHTLAAFDADNDAKIAAKQAADADRATISDTVVQHMMAAEKRRVDSTRHPCSLTLLLDFEELRQQRFRTERQSVEDEEAAKRQWLVQEMEEERKGLIAVFQQRLQEMIEAVQAQLRAEQEAREREEAARKAEEDRKKAEEEAKRRAELEAERRRRAEEEEAKRAERKRKEDERRAKAKAEREARNKAAAGGAANKPSSAGGGDRPSSASAAAAAAPTGREARLKRQHDAVSLDSVNAAELTGKIRELATSAECVEDFFQQLCDLLGNGSVLFHTCIYAGSLSADGSKLEYFAASQNCSELLRGGMAALPVLDSAPLQAMVESAGAGSKHVGPVACNTLRHVGSPSQEWPPAHGGEAAFFPVVVDGKLWGTISIDTASSNSVDPESSFQLPQEDGCYSEGQQCTEEVKISAEVVSFMEEIAGVASSAASALPSKRAPAAAAGAGKFSIDLDPIRNSNSLAMALATITGEIRKGANNAAAGAGDDSAPAPIDCYISMVQRQPKSGGESCSALVVAHNGFSVLGDQSHSAGADKQAAPQHLLGGRVGGDAKTFSLPTSAALETKPHAFVPDVAASDSGCALFDKALEQEKKSGESLLLIPILVPAAAHQPGDDDSNNNTLWGALGVSGASAALAQQINNCFWDSLRPFLLGALKALALHGVCRQAIDWLQIATGCRNIYIAVTSAHNKRSSDDVASSSLRIVAGSGGFSADSTSRDGGVGGLSHPFAAGAVGHTHDGAATTKHLPSLAAAEGLELWHSKSSSTPESLEKAQGLMCAIAQGSPDSKVHGILYGDTIKTSSSSSNGGGGGGSDTISPSDIDIFKLTAQLLAATLDGQQEDDAAANGKKLAIESEAGGADVAFLGRLFRHALASIRGITNGQLQELARYPAPPPVIPTTVASAVILLGNSRATTEWAKLRKQVKQTLIDKIGAFDPTSPSSKAVKKSCVIKARSLTKGLTATDVFTKGSHPASCLFTWIFICLLLRKFAKASRDRAASNDAKEAVGATLGMPLAGGGGGGASVGGSATAEEDEDDGGAEDDDHEPQQDEGEDDDDDDEPASDEEEEE